MSSTPSAAPHSPAAPGPGRTHAGTRDALPTAAVARSAAPIEPAPIEPAPIEPAPVEPAPAPAPAPASVDAAQIEPTLDPLAVPEPPHDPARETIASGERTAAVQPARSPALAAATRAPGRLPAAALLVDFENVLYGLSNRFGPQRAAELVCLSELLAVVRERLWPSVRRAYGDWRARELGAWQGELYRHGFEVVPVLSKPGGTWRKNASDIRLAVDAIELALTSPHLETFVIVSGDRDMVEIVRCLQRHGKRVWCIAPEASASSDLTGVCDAFLPYARLSELAGHVAGALERAANPAPPSATAETRGIFDGDVHKASPVQGAHGNGGNGGNGGSGGSGGYGHGSQGHSGNGNGAYDAPSASAPNLGPATFQRGHGHPGPPPGMAFPGPREVRRAASGLPSEDVPPAQQELLAQTDLVRTGFEPDCTRRRERLVRWYAFAEDREQFTLVEVFDALAEGLASNRSALAKLFTMLYQGRAFELANYDPSIPFRERTLRFTPEVRSADDLVRLHERSALARLVQGDPAVATPDGARVLLGLAESERAYAEALLEEVRAQREGERPGAKAAPGTWAGIEAGQRRKGIVKKVADYGAVVALDGIDGLLHVSDISWGRIEHPAHILSPNQEIEVLVLDVEPARGRVNLWLKQLTPSPWTNVDERYPVGSEHEGVVIALKHYGAFVDLEQGVTGLVHNSEVSWARHVHHPSELLELGQKVRVQVQELDREKRRIALSIRASQPNPWEFAELGYPVGSVVEGRVTYLAGYGAFVELEHGLQGLLHVSELAWTRQPAHPSELLAVGDPVRCRVLSVDAQHGRMALGLKQLEPDPWEHGLAERLPVGSEHDCGVLRIDKEGPAVLLADGVEARLERAPDSAHLSVGDRLRVRIDRVDAEARKIHAEFVHGDFPENSERRAAGQLRLDALRIELAVLLEERKPEPWLGSKLKEELARRHGTRFDEGVFGAPTFARLLDLVPDVVRVERRDGADILVHRA